MYGGPGSGSAQSAQSGESSVANSPRSVETLRKYMHTYTHVRIPFIFNIQIRTQSFPHTHAHTHKVLSSSFLP